MKKIIVILTISTFGLLLSANAQKVEKTHAKQKQAVLQLTDAQHSQMTDLKKKRKEEEKSIKSNSNLSDADKKKQLKELHKNYKTKETALLTPVQKAKLDSLKTVHKAEKKHKKNK